MNVAWMWINIILGIQIIRVVVLSNRILEP